MGRRLIVGDIHGHYKLLREVLDKAAFDPKEDTLFSVGDFFDKTDSFGETIATMEYILYLNKLGCLKAVLGNHDAWLEQYLILHWASSNWKDNGGYTTIAAANAIGDYRREDLREFLSELPLIIFDGNDIIMHAGPYKCTTEEELKELSERKRPVPAFRYANQYDFPLEPDHDEEFLKKQKWVVDILFERDYIFSSVPKEEREKRTGYWFINEEMKPINTDKTIWVGHTPLVDDFKPLIRDEYHLIAIDTGALLDKGPLTLMDMDSREIWQAGPDKFDRKGLSDW